MSASPDESAKPMKGLQHIPVTKIERNAENPRLVFTQEEMDRLSESIAAKGILVPIVVYEEGDHYVLIDGERRWRCAQELGLETIPAVITEPTDSRENLVQMFNIHMVREPWADMPTAWALERLMAETGIESDKELSDLTGLSRERIQRLRHALELPKDYQQYIHEGTIPLNFFWELKRNVIEPLARHRPVLLEEFGPDEVRKAFVAKRLGGVITDTVALRNVRPIITMAAREVGALTDPSPLDDTIRDLITKSDMTIEDAYEDTVQVIVEADKLQRRTENMVKGFQRLLLKAKSADELEYVKGVARQFVKQITNLIK